VLRLAPTCRWLPRRSAASCAPRRVSLLPPPGTPLPPLHRRCRTTTNDDSPTPTASRTGCSVAVRGAALLRRPSSHAVFTARRALPLYSSRRQLTTMAAIPGTDVVSSSGMLEAGYTYLDVRCGFSHQSTSIWLCSAAPHGPWRGIPFPTPSSSSSGGGTECPGAIPLRLRAPS